MARFELVMPCYNEGANLYELYQRVVNAALRHGLTPNDFRLFLVDNGSTDDTAARIQALLDGPNGEYLHPVKVPFNRGYGFGVWSGLLQTTAECVGWTHGDGQCDPEDALLAWREWNKRGQTPLVKGRRRQRTTYSAWAFSRFFDFTTLLLTGRWLHEINAQPKVFSRSLLSEIGEPPTNFTFDLHFLLRAKALGVPFTEVDVRFLPRRHGQSHWAADFRSKVRTIRGFLEFLVKNRTGNHLG